ncbi:MAG: hypothetical protein HYT48_00225 [Candidatus Vogelbacteria bacterium]|nr:hypothetical protein [Candidatus Vogelbacteria bacterium]
MSTKPPEKLVLLDAHAILHRAYHALPEFVSAKGEPTGGLYGLAAMLVKIINDLKPDYLAACYDLAETTFRKQIYDGYKSGRAKADLALVAQMIRSRDVFAAFNIPIYDKVGFEADDIIGTVVEQMKKRKNLQIIIASGDMDTLQLVEDKKVVVYTLKKGINDTILYDEKKVEERYGFGPKLLPDFKGLAGDQSDNIIGIHGIGEKTATDLIQKFGTLEQMYQKLKPSDVKERVYKLLTEGEEEALFSKTLAVIRRDAPVKFELPAEKWREGVDLAVIDKLFTELEFRTMTARVKAAIEGAPIISSTSDVEEVSEALKIAFWLLNSEITNPATGDILRFTNSKSFKEAEDKLLAAIKKNNLEKVYQEIELPLIPILERAECHGILVDVAYLKKLSKEYHARLKKLEEKIYKLAGGEFNINSPRQLGEILFDQLTLNVKGLKKTAGGARSTRESELLKLKDSHPIIEEILSHRELQKLLSTYVDTIPAAADKENRLHTKLHQTGAATGRMSSSNPNLQNIPASAIFGQEIRRAFLATPGFKWAAFDYSQIEMRVLAMLSGDSALSRIFQSGEDVHTAVAMRVFKVAEPDVTREMRRRAKVINFGIIYGMGVSALQRNLGSDRVTAQEFYNSYFAAFPKIKNYFTQTITQAKKSGYTETFFGRRRYLPGLKSALPQIKAMNERMAMNAPLQGTAADIVKLAMINIDKLIEAKDWQNQVYLLLQVHDELIYEIADALVAEAAPLIKSAMEAVVSGEVPILAHTAIGDNWAEAK